MKITSNPYFNRTVSNKIIVRVNTPLRLISMLKESGDLITEGLTNLVSWSLDSRPKILGQADNLLILKITKLKYENFLAASKKYRRVITFYFKISYFPL